MDMKLLDEKLRALTPSEIRYKYENAHFDYSQLPIVERMGKKAYLMNFSPNQLTAINNKIAMKKQSRYDSCLTHVHNWIEFEYMYSGSCVQHINDTTYMLKEHQVLLIDTDVPHSCEPLGDNDILINLTIQKEYLTSNFFNRLSQDSILSRFFINVINEEADHKNFFLFPSENSPNVVLYFNQLIGEIMYPTLNSIDIVNSLITLIICSLLNAMENNENKRIIDDSKNLIAPILRYIEAHCKDCTLESTAIYFNFNPNYMTTLLKQRTGYSYKELIQQQRLAQAAYYLRNTAFSTSKVANVVGYENISFFYKKFKEQFGCTPKDYRRQNSS